MPPCSVPAGTGCAVPPVPWHWPCRDTLCATLAVLHSGEYFLFESDSEEEEEVAVPEEPRPGRQSAFQVSMAGGPGGAGGAHGEVTAPLPTPARLPGLGDQHQDGAAAAGAAGATRYRGRCRWVWLTPKWGWGGRKGTQPYPMPTVCPGCCWHPVKGRHLSGVPGVCVDSLMATMGLGTSCAALLWCPCWVLSRTGDRVRTRRAPAGAGNNVHPPLSQCDPFPGGGLTHCLPCRGQRREGGGVGGARRG